MKINDLNILRNEVEAVVHKHSDVLGVLAVNATSDSYVDLLLSIRDTELSSSSRRLVELGGAALLEEVSGGTLRPGTAQWHNKKRMVFGDCYENPDLYPDSFRRLNGYNAPWDAAAFRDDLAYRLQGSVFDNGSLKVQAQPESLFHLRPDPHVIEADIIDTIPFPTLLNNAWISEKDTKEVVYTSPDARIFPFVADGCILGEIMQQYIDETRNNSRVVNYGGVLLKPDALEGNQVDIILDKISTHIAQFGGKIVLQKTFDSLSKEDVQSIYPLLRGRELEYAVRYLTSGPVMGVVIEARSPASEVLKKVNGIKGPRIGDRSEARLQEGRIENGGIRDLLPLPEDEDKYRSLLAGLRRRRRDPSYLFTDEEYRYLARNLAHTPDNTVELIGLLSFMGFTYPK